MKKIIAKSFVCLLILISFCPLLIGCGENLAWARTYNNLENFFNNRTIQIFIDDENTEPLFSEDILSIIQQDDNINEPLYAQFESVYKNMSTKCYSVAKRLMSVFQETTPIISRLEAKDWCEKIDFALSRVSASIGTMRSEYLSLVETVENAGPGNLPAWLDVKDFRKAYANYIYIANEFNQTFISAFEHLYKPLKLQKNDQTGDYLVAFCDSYSVLLNDCIEYTFREYDGDVKIVETVLWDSVEGLFNKINKMGNGISYTRLANNYENWLGFRQMCLNESNIFRKALSQVNYPELLEHKSNENGNYEFTEIEKVNMQIIESYRDVYSFQFADLTYNIIQMN